MYKALACVINRLSAALSSASSSPLALPLSSQIHLLKLLLWHSTKVTDSFPPSLLLSLCLSFPSCLVFSRAFSQTSHHCMIQTACFVRHPSKNGTADKCCNDSGPGISLATWLRDSAPICSQTFTLTEHLFHTDATLLSANSTFRVLMNHGVQYSDGIFPPCSDEHSLFWLYIASDLRNFFLQNTMPKNPLPEGSRSINSWLLSLSRM